MNVYPNKSWSIYTMKYYSVIKRNEMNLEDVMLSERSQENPPVAWSHWCDMSRTGRCVRTESGLVVARGWGGQWEMTVFWNQRVVIIVQLYESTRNHWTVHFHRVTFVLREWSVWERERRGLLEPTAVGTPRDSPAQGPACGPALPTQSVLTRIPLPSPSGRGTHKPWRWWRPSLGGGPWSCGTCHWCNGWGAPCSTPCPPWAAHTGDSSSA